MPETAIIIHNPPRMPRSVIKTIFFPFPFLKTENRFNQIPVKLFVRLPFAMKELNNQVFQIVGKYGNSL